MPEAEVPHDVIFAGESRARMLSNRMHSTDDVVHDNICTDCLCCTGRHVRRCTIQQFRSTAGSPPVGAVIGSRCLRRSATMRAVQRLHRLSRPSSRRRLRGNCGT